MARPAALLHPPHPTSQAKDALAGACEADIANYERHFAKLPGWDSGAVALEDAADYFGGEFLRVRARACAHGLA